MTLTRDVPRSTDDTPSDPRAWEDAPRGAPRPSPRLSPRLSPWPDLSAEGDLEAQIAAWDGLGVVSVYHPPAAAWIFIALHDDTLGRPTGGTRTRVYRRPVDGLRDAQRLAESMTCKWAMADLDRGGGKAVLALSRPLPGAERVGLFRRYGRLLASLRGAFATGQDLGTHAEDLRVVAEETSFVHGAARRVADGADLADLPDLPDLGPDTALGVLAAIRAVVGRAFGRRELTGRRVLVQGVGAVGAPLARELAREGATVLVADLDGDRARSLASELGAQVVAPELAAVTPCDVFAPCAVGGVLTLDGLEGLTCRAVAGAANNQLEEPRVAEALADRGVLWAPDFVASGGAAIASALRLRGAGPAEVAAAVEAIGERIDALFEDAAAGGMTVLEAARRRVAERLSAARASRSG